MFHPIYERLNQLCFKHGIDITNLCIEIKSSISKKEKEASSGNLSTWKKGNFKSTELIAIKNKLNCSIDWLLTGVSEVQPAQANQQTDEVSPIPLIEQNTVEDVRRNSKINIINSIIGVMKLQKLTIRDLSVRTNISENIINAWFRGETLPNAYELQSLSLILDVSADHLLAHTRTITTLTEVQDKDNFIYQVQNYAAISEFTDKYGVIMDDNNFQNIAKLFTATTSVQIEKANKDRIGMFNLCEGYMHTAGYDTERILNS